VRAENPSSEVQILLPERLDHNSALNNLVLVGGAAVARAAGDESANTPDQEVQRFAPDIPLPVAEPIPGTKTHTFVCSVGDETRRFESSLEKGALVEDIGLIARGPHPNVPGRTVTMLSGITSRGVHGAALCFIHRDLRDSNERFLKDAFGKADAFCLLMRVPVRNNVAFPPNLADRKNRLYEWSRETAARFPSDRAPILGSANAEKKLPLSTKGFRLLKIVNCGRYGSVTSSPVLAGKPSIRPGRYSIRCHRVRAGVLSSAAS
jgi:hypothetical protein